LCTYNTSRIDLGKSPMMNYQGTGFVQIFIMMPILFAPVLIYACFDFAGISQYGYYALAFLGVLGIAFHPYLLQRVADQFLKRKYKMAVGFRQR